MTKIAIFASGGGSNAEAIVSYFKNHEKIEVALLLTNNADAGVIARGKRLSIPTLVFSKQNYQDPQGVLRMLQLLEIDFIVLAGFLWLVPEHFINAYPDKIVNIHPALLPKYGGKGMWGHHVHEAVVAAGEKESGITIHYVNQHYDEGAPIFQASCALEPTDTPEQVAAKVLLLEHKHYPEVIERLLQ